ncbi:Mechanosensitive ion channel [Bacteroides luti]|jgi:small-conductance mechanosensitive channel|uniref:Mechanosensitive ion channel n=1 Tax=Bacteroides luti TaxID=1297750 RepID=A0A1M4SIU6_9BACE|nr:mechanosensitive ion channel family protein [Bacteroides luti]SHE32130.1 Mechanosensitive ion channel [Bacteroides luti]
MNKIIENIKIVLVCSFFICTSSILRAQDNIVMQKEDSSNTAILHDYQNKLAKIEQQRILDSVQRKDLEAQLKSLKTMDNLKKEELQKQLQALNNREKDRLAQKKAQIDLMKHTAKGYPVMGFFKDTLFIIYSKIGSFTAAERAKAVSNRIYGLSDIFNFMPDSLKLIDAETSVDLFYGDKIIMSVTENDAIWNNSTKQLLANKYKEIIGNAVMHHNDEVSFPVLAKNIGLAILVFLIMGGGLLYSGKLFKWTFIQIIKQKGKIVSGIKIKNYTLLDADRQVRILVSINNIFKWFIYLLIIYIALTILFSIFPWTENLANILFFYIVNPIKKIATGFWNYLPNLITVIVIVVVFHYILKGFHFLKTEIEKENLRLPSFYPEWANPTYQIIRILIYAFMLVAIFPYLPGSDSHIFQGVSVFLGFLFTFGSSGSISNIVAGFVITYMRLFTIGDRVKIGEIVGDVIEKSLLVTRIRTIKNEIISIPNSIVMASHTINYNRDAVNNGLIIYTTVTIGYDVPWKDVHQALIDASLRTEFVLHDPKPFVLQTSLDDFYVSYEINAYINEPNKQAVIYSDLRQNIQDVFNERGIEIMSPHYRALRDGNQSSIPAEHLPEDYKTPTFNINMRKGN